VIDGGTELTGVAELVAEVSAKFGPARVTIPHETRPMNTERGTCYRRCWVWFPERVNHHFAIDRYTLFALAAPVTDRTPNYHVWAGKHVGTQVGLWCFDPTPDKVRAVLVLAGFVDGDVVESHTLLAAHASRSTAVEFVENTPEV